MSSTDILSVLGRYSDKSRDLLLTWKECLSATLITSVCYITIRITGSTHPSTVQAWEQRREALLKSGVAPDQVPPYPQLLHSNLSSVAEVIKASEGDLIGRGPVSQQ
jgi:hypothetical protein